MKFSKLDKKANISSWMIVGFILIVTLSAVFTKLFQRPVFYESEQQNIKSPIKIEYLTDLESLMLTNYLGSFRVIKNNKYEISAWDLISPRELPGNKNTIEQIIDVLSQIKVRKIIPYDSINENNYSLTNPIIKITLEMTNHEPITINVGLINPIDNSSYIALDDKKYIYQIDMLATNLGTLELSDFIDPMIISIPRSYITRLKIFTGQTKTFDIIKQDDNWTSFRSYELASEKVEEYLDKLTSIKRSIILDTDSPQLEQIKKKYLHQNPAYQIEITSTGGNVYSYYVSKLVKESFSELKIEKKQSFIMNASDRKYPYVISKSALPIFNMNTSKLRRPRR